MGQYATVMHREVKLSGALGEAAYSLFKEDAREGVLYRTQMSDIAYHMGLALNKPVNVMDEYGEVNRQVMWSRISDWQDFEAIIAWLDVAGPEDYLCFS